MDSFLKFDYFYGAESEQFSFIRLPKLLFKDGHFKSLSLEAKLVYGLMLDRMSLSVKNGWLDEENRVYIVYTVSTIAEEIGCSRDKAGRILSELDSVKGIGLVERVRRGLGRPDIIYVKNFGKMVVEPEIGLRNASEVEIGEKESVKSAYQEAVNHDISASAKISLSTKLSAENVAEAMRLGSDREPKILENTQRLQKPASRNRKTRHQEAADYDIKKPQITTSGSRDLRHQDAAKPGTNNNDINNTEYSDTSIESIPSVNDGSIRLVDNREEAGGMDGTDIIIEQLKKNLDYDWHMEHDKVGDRETYHNYFELIKDVVTGDRDTMRIDGAVYPMKLVRERFMSLRSEHIDYARSCIEEHEGDIRNFRNYTISALFNAPATIGSYYSHLYTYNELGDGRKNRKTG